MRTSAKLFKWIAVSLFVACTAGLSHAQPSNCTPPPSGLVSWWRAEGDGVDSISGNTAYAALLPGGVTFAPGKVGQAFQLNGTNAYLFVPASPNLNVGAGDGLTMEGWINVSSVSGLHPIAEWHGDTRQEVGVQFWLNSNPSQNGALLGALVDTNFNQHNLISPDGILQPNVFQHVALTYDKASGVGTLYLNGVVVAQATLGSFTPLTSYDLWMAHRPFDVPGDWTYGATLGGLLDEFSIYNRALSSNEIAGIYVAGSAGKCSGPSGVAPAITQQPTNQTVTAGGTATFSATATGTGPLYYQWYGPASNLIPGATGPALTLSNVQQSATGSYFVLVTNLYGFTQSSNALLTVNASGPTETGLVLPNYSATNQLYFSLAGTLNEPSRLQTVYGASEFPPYPITINEIRWRPDAYVAGPFSITISNLQIKLSTTIASPDHLSTIFAQNSGPDETTVFSGVANVSSAFTTLSNGTTAFDIRLPLQTPFVFDSTKGNLLVDLRNLFGCTPPRGNIVNAAGGVDATSRVFASDPNATNATVADTAGDVLEIIYTAANTGVAPMITHQPTNQTVATGGNAVFSATATGTAPLHYQWYGPAAALIPGATSSTLTLSNVQSSAAGSYYVWVTNLYGFAQSSNAVLTVTGGGGNTNSNCTPPPSGLVSWWPGEGNGNDVVSSNNAILESGVTFAPGKVGQAFQLLNYTNGFMHVPASSSLDVGAGSGMTMEGWINVSSVDGMHPIAEWYGTNRGVVGSQLWIDPTPYNNGALFGVLVDTNSNVYRLTSADGVLQPNVFQHVAMTYDKASGIGTLYLNGAIVAQGNFGSFVPQTSYNLWIGHRPFDVPGDWTYGAILGGLLDEFSLYNRALSSNEIAAIYNAGNAGKCGGVTNSGVAPMITHQPTNQTVAASGTASFTATATGTAPLHYQWYGPAAALIPGATTSTLTLSNVQQSAAGSYYLWVTNLYGFAQSSNAVLTVTSGGGNTNSNCAPPPSGLVSWWKGELNTLDSAGTNNGFAINGSLAYAVGEVGNAFHSAATNGYVEVPASPSLDVGQGGGFTLEGWIQPADLVNQAPLFEWQYNTNNGFSGAHFWISVGSAGCLYANIVDTNSNSHIVSSAPGILTAEFQHVALTYDKSSGIASIYRNGLLVAQSNLGAFTPNTTGNFLLGERTYLGGNPQVHYVGNLDEMSVYSRALASNEIAAIYSAGSAGKCSGGTNTGVAPMITQQPTNQTVPNAGIATFSVTATGTAPLIYTWYHAGAALTGGTTNSTFGSYAYLPNAGAYYVVITNQFGSATSSVANLIVTGGSCTTPPSGLAAWWRAEGNALDSINGNNGTIVGGVTYTSNVVGQAFYFNGTNGYISVPASPSLDIGTGAGLTIECWIKPDHLGPVGEAGRPIVEYDTASSIGVHLYFEDGNTIYANLVDTTGANHTIQSASVNFLTNSPSYVAVSYNKTNGICFLLLNGSIVASNYLGSFTPQTSYPLSIGRRSAQGFPGSGVVYNGMLDELSLYNRGLSQSELQAIYFAGPAGKCVPPPGVAPAITQQPTNQTVVAGSTATFSATATGTAPLYYQWYGPASALVPGANSSTLMLSNVQQNAAGSYYLLVTNLYGFAQSSNAVLTVTGGGGNTNSTCTPPASGLVSWWPGEGNGHDVVGSNNAVLESGVTFAPGEVGQAFQMLDYSNGFMHVPASPTLNVGAGSGLTMEGWIKVSSVSGMHPIAEYHGDTREKVGTLLWIDAYQWQNGALGAVLVDTNSNQYTLISADGVLVPNTFQHVALTYDKASGMGTLYLNGVVVDHAIFNSFVPQTTYDLWIGHRPLDVPGDSTYGTTLGGLLDEFSIYNRALSSNEIAAIYNAGSAGKCTGSSTNPGVAPLITKQPTNQAVAAGATASFSATATGTAPLHYQWFGPTNALIAGATSSTLTLSNVQSGAAGGYFVFVTNAYGFAYSSNALLTVTGGTNSGTAPVIIYQPTNTTVLAGGNAYFSVFATGAPPLSYQWYAPQSVLIGGATNTVLILSNVQPGNAGSYRVIVMNPYGFAPSSNAVLTVTGGATNSCAPVPSGLVSWWAGENNSLDSVGTNNGFASHGSLAYAVGKVGNAFHAETTNGYVDVPASASLNVGQGAGFTLEGWIQPADLVNQAPLFEWQYNTNNGFIGTHFWISVGSAGCLFANVVDTTNNAHTLSSAPGILTADFQHVALTYDKSSGIASIYRNGTLVAQSNIGSFIPNTTGDLLLGERTYLGGAPQVQYTGNLDEMSLYSRALASNEIAAIYSAGSFGKCSPPVVPHSLTSQQPGVNLSVPGNAEVVSWPASAGGYILQSANSLLPPITWTNVPAMLETNDGTIDTILPTTGLQGFFRLYHP